MQNDEMLKKALQVGRKRATETLKSRTLALKRREKVMKVHNVKKKGIVRAGFTPEQSVGVLVAEGDSWFDYPLNDVLKGLEDDYGYDVESVAHKGDPIEEMAYAGGQLDDLTRRIEKLLRNGLVPKAILLSGGGNDIAGKEFGMLLNHAQSAVAGLNTQIIEGVIDQRIRLAYITILSSVTHICEEKLGRQIPILVHGYDYPVPDGRGFMGGWWVLPGPWLEPGFREKGFDSLPQCTKIARDLIDRFNAMLEKVADLESFSHVQYINLRNTLSNKPANYKDWWANELHPSNKGFELVTKRFAKTLQTL